MAGDEETTFKQALLSRGLSNPQARIAFICLTAPHGAPAIQVERFSTTAEVKLVVITGVHISSLIRM